MSKEEEWYPVSYAQKQKEKEEAEWVANNPNATAAELFYPSMRKKDVTPVIPPVVQPASQSIVQRLPETSPANGRKVVDLSNLSPEQQKELEFDENMTQATGHHNNYFVKRQPVAKRLPETGLTNGRKVVDLASLSPEQRKELASNASMVQTTGHHKSNLPSSSSQPEIDYTNGRRAIDLANLSPEQRKELASNASMTQATGHHNSRSFNNNRDIYSNSLPKQAQKRKNPANYHGMGFSSKEIGYYINHGKYYDSLSDSQQARFSKSIDKIINLSDVTKETYGSIVSNGDRARKIADDFPTLTPFLENEDTHVELAKIREQHAFHAQNSLPTEKGTSIIPPARRWIVRERDLDGARVGFPIPPRGMNLDVFHQHFVADDGLDIGYGKGEAKGEIGRDQFLDKMEDSEEFEGIVLHDTYLQAAINILRPKYGADSYNLAYNNCQDFISDVISLGDEIAKMHGESIYLENNN